MVCMSINSLHNVAKSKEPSHHMCITRTIKESIFFDASTNVSIMRYAEDHFPHVIQLTIQSMERVKL